MRSLIIALVIGALAIGGCSAGSQGTGSTAAPQQSTAAVATTPIASAPIAPVMSMAPMMSLAPVMSMAPQSPAAPTTTPTPVPASVPVAASGPLATVPSSPATGVVAGTTAKPRLVDLTADDTLTFFPNVVHAVEGETVTFRIQNIGKADHEFMLGPVGDAFADKKGTAEVQGIGAGQTKMLTFTFAGPGPYAFACHEPGHFEAGMVGYVVVSGPDVPAAGTPGSPRLVEVAMTDKLAFVPAQIDAAKGETVLFLITNEGAATHEFAVGPAERVDADQIDGTTVIEVDEIVQHHLKVVTYTFSGAGPYAFACHEPGHFEAGMVGKVIVD